MNVRLVGELGEDRCGVPDASADDKNVVVRADAERLEQPTGRARGEHSCSEPLRRAIRVGWAIFDERLSGNRPHGNTGLLRADDRLRLVFEAIDHIVAEHRWVHTVGSVLHPLQSRACSRKR